MAEVKPVSMDNLGEFLFALASHWLLLSMAVGAILFCQFGQFDGARVIIPTLIVFALGCIILALYLTVAEPLQR
jgi:hypothetical protein